MSALVRRAAWARSCCVPDPQGKAMVVAVPISCICAAFDARIHPLMDMDGSPVSDQGCSNQSNNELFRLKCTLHTPGCSCFMLLASIYDIYDLNVHKANVHRGGHERGGVLRSLACGMRGLYDVALSCLPVV